MAPRPYSRVGEQANGSKALLPSRGKGPGGTAILRRRAGAARALKGHIWALKGHIWALKGHIWARAAEGRAGWSGAERGENVSTGGALMLSRSNATGIQ